MDIKSFVITVFSKLDISNKIVTVQNYENFIMEYLSNEKSVGNISNYRVFSDKYGVSVDITKGSRAKVFYIPDFEKDSTCENLTKFLMEEVRYFHRYSALEITTHLLMSCKKLYRFRVKVDNQYNYVVIYYEIIPGKMQKFTTPNDDNLHTSLKDFMNGLK